MYLITYLLTYCCKCSTMKSMQSNVEFAGDPPSYDFSIAHPTPSAPPASQSYPLQALHGQPPWAGGYARQPGYGAPPPPDNRRHQRQQLQQERQVVVIYASSQERAP